VTLRARLARPWFPVGVSEGHLVIDVQARAPEAPETDRPPVRIALVIDRSGSMAGQKLAEAKRAAHHLLSLLGTRDRLALVHYGSEVRALPELPVTAGTRERLSAFIDAIHDEGGTNIGGGLEAAFRALAEPAEGNPARRLILLSDGQPTEGITDEAGLWTLAGRLREHGVAVSALGVGLDFNDRLMQGLAQRGGGFYGYLRDASALADIFARELDQATRTVARGPGLHLTLPPGVTATEVLGLPSSSEGGVLRVPLYDLAAGSSARVVVRLRIAASGTAAGMPVAQVSLRYADGRTGEGRETSTRVTGTATQDAQVAESHVDADATAQVNRALGARRMAEAAQAFREGRRDVGLGLLDNVRSLFGASASALAGEIQDLDRTRAALVDARSGDDVQDGAKRLELKAFESYGQSNSY
jgi:Ca-activated chloride channel family protein